MLDCLQKNLDNFLRFHFGETSLTLDGFNNVIFGQFHFVGIFYSILFGLNGGNKRYYAIIIEKIKYNKFQGSSAGDRMFTETPDYYRVTSEVSTAEEGKN